MGLDSVALGGAVPGPGGPDWYSGHDRHPAWVWPQGPPAVHRSDEDAYRVVWTGTIDDGRTSGT
ncbi:hypothetical protein F8G81_12915 [Arthrobacter sp. CDRTa11]|uniref:hypothetical protein n=1 Tax=Arthrobacter sp. CDRTa11 TaxID=2651199 RepID=UPI0022659ECD|nr:hypothetical protein [Arthrobacter sp. CDRTa11]UZX03412.1 hypothetical protein F8G81_12915 [Arthrobacter sp. CDRTa11]